LGWGLDAGNNGNGPIRPMTRRLRSMSNIARNQVLEVAWRLSCKPMPMRCRRWCALVSLGGDSRWRRQSKDRRDVRKFDKREIAPDACLPYDPRGLVVVAGGWLAFYVIAAIHDVIASGY
jgi:hypothetical protein